MGNAVASTIQSQPLFRSLDKALRFAYTIEAYPAYPKSELARLLRGSVRSVEDMNVLDWHAQASLIRVHVQTHLRGAERAFIECWYGTREEYKEGIHGIVSYVIPRVIGTGMVKRRLILELARRYFLSGSARRPTYREIAERVGVPIKAIEKYGQRVQAAIISLGRLAEAELEGAFRAGGLIE
jgi:hypothetical protein